MNSVTDYYISGMLPWPFAWSGSIDRVLTSIMSRITALIATTLLAVPAVTASFPDCKNGPTALRTNAVCDTSKSPEVRAAAIIKAMTLQEKMNNTGKYVVRSPCFL
jgi:hypothetical protein